ncbi:hypothetical protein ScPMuIL_005349 [Solemya velum]
MEYLWLLVLVLVAGAHSGPARNPVSVVRVQDESVMSCSRQCTATNKFSYVPKMSYQYDYETETRTSMQGASDEQATLKITARATIDVLTKCDLVLKLQNVMVYGSDPNNKGQLRLEDQSGEFQQALERYPLRFSFQDGVIERLCTYNAEPSWVRNIKRGVLSTFQNSMDSLERDQTARETDVTGTCDTEYKLAYKGWQSTTVKKSKDLVSCGGRHGHETAMQSTKYRLPSSFQSLPLMKSSHNCDQEISSNGRIKQVICHEFHVFRPFSKDNSGATTEVTQKLEFISERPSQRNRKEPVELEGTMEFEHTLGEKEPERNRREAERILRELCESTVSDVRPETPQIFSELVYILKKMDTYSMRYIYNQVQSETFCPSNARRTKKFLVDAVPMVGTGAAVGLMRKLIADKEVTGIEAEMWLTSLSFIHHPTREMLSEILALMNLKEVQSEVLLSMSSMVHRFCESDTECEKYTEVTDIITALEQNIGHGCTVDDSNYKQVLISLRAIGNAGHADRLVPVLDNCLGRRDNPMDIRVAAAEAFRRLSCGADRNNLMLRFRNSEEDSELRIASYWSVMQCPTVDILSQVRMVLEREEVNQVGSFVWSHLTNLMETSDPHKQEIREILEDEILKREFDLDKRKFSRNYEGSFFWKKLGAGAKLESNLVWSTESFIPRSVMANLTIDIFGNSLNLLEVGGRMEGLEYLLESYFGPSGYFSDSKDTGENPEPPSHSKISGQKMNRINNMFGALKDKLKASMYLRVFGNELQYTNLAGPEMSGDGFNILEFFIKLAKNRDYSVSKSLMFLDSTMIIPTASGLPLNLTVNGTATIDLKASGRMDLRKPSTSLLIDGTLQPSGAVQISSMMSVDAYVTKGGLKMTSTLHSSTALQGRVEMSKSQIVSVEINTPRDKMEILDVRTEFFTVHRDIETRQNLITENRKEKSVCTGPWLAKMSGLELCGAVEFSNASMVTDAPYFPFTGPVVMSLVLHKRDTHTGYKFEAKKIKTADESLYRVFFDTPGSKVDRSIAVDAIAQHKQNAVELNLVSPWKKALFKGSLINSEEKKQVKGNFIIDGTREYALVAGVERNQSGEGIKYIPTLHLTIPRRDSIHLTGMVEYLQKKKIAAELNLRGTPRGPLAMSAVLINTDEAVGLTTAFSYDGDKEYLLDAKVGIQEQKKKMFFEPVLHVKTPQQDLNILGGKIEYRRSRMIILDLKFAGFIKPSILKCTASKYIRNTRTKLSGKLTFKHPKAHTKFNFVVDRTNPKIGLNMKLDYNFARYFSWAKDTIVSSSNINMKSSSRDKLLRVQTSFDSARYSDYNNKLDFAFNQHNRLSDVNFGFHYGRELENVDNKQKLLITMTSKHLVTWPDVDLTYNISLQLPAQDVNVLMNGNHKQSTQEVTSNTHIQYGEQKSIDSSIRLSNNSKTRFGVSGEASLTFPTRHIFVSGDITEGSRKDYNVRVTFEPSIQHRSTVEANLRKVNDKSYQIDSTFNIYNQKPLQIRSAFSYDPKSLMAQGELLRGKDRYLFKGSSAMKVGRGGKINFEIQYPESHFVLGLEGSRRKNKVRGKMEVDWDADNKNGDSHFLLEGSGDFQNIDDFGGTINLQYPSRTIIANIKHKTGDRYITHADIAWNLHDKIVFDLTMRDIVESHTRRLEGDLEFSSPFEGYEMLNVTLSHVMAVNQFMSKASILWGRKQKILSSLMIRRPISPRNFHINGLLETPYEVLRHFVVKVDHDLDDNLVTSVATEIGEKRFETVVNGSYTHTPQNSDIRANMEVKSNIPNMKKMWFSFRQEKNPNSFFTKFSNNINGENYLYELKTTSPEGEWMNDNQGSLLMSSPKEVLQTTWMHRWHKTLNWKKQTLNTSLTSTWGRGQRFHADITGNYMFQLDPAPLRKFDFKANFDVPTKKLKQLGFSMNHEDRLGYIHTEWSVETNREKTSSVSLNYRRGEGDVDFDFTSFNLGRDDIVLRLNSEYGTQPYRGHVELDWGKYQRAVLDGSLHFTDEGELDGSLQYSSPIPGFEDITLAVGHKREGLGWNTHTNLNLGHQRDINLAIRYRNQEEKTVRWTLTTPYRQVSSIEGGITLEITKEGFSCKTDFEMQPMVGRCDADIDFKAVWEHRRGDVDFKFHINTPDDWISYIRGKYNGKFREREGTEHLFEVEYVPTKVISLKTTYSNYIQNHLDGSVLFESPFTSTIDASFVHDGNLQKFHTHAEITYDGQKHNVPYVLDLNFSLKPKIAGRFSMTSPIQGYKDVTLSFSHQGNLKSFDTSVEYDTNGDKIHVETGFSVVEPYRGKFILKTPFPEVEITRVSYLHRGSVLDFHNEMQLTYNEYNFEHEATFRHLGSATSGLLVVKTPFRGFTENRIGGSKTGTLESFTVNGELQYGQRKRFTFQFQNTLDSFHHLDNRIAVTTPYTEDLESHFTYTHADAALSYLLDAQMGADNSIHYKYDYTLNKELYQLDIFYESRVVIVGEAKSTQYSIHHLGPLTNFENKVIFGTDENIYSTDVAFNLHQVEGRNIPIWALLKNVEGHLQIKSPFPQFENGKIYFRNAAQASGLNSNGELMYNSKKLSASLDVTLKPNLLITVNVNTPFSGYEDMSASIHYTKGGEVHKVKVIANYARGKTITILSILNMDSPTMSGNVKITTPFQDFRTMEIALTHKGDNLRNLHSTISVTSSQFSPVQGELSLRYSSPSNLDVTVKILSSIDGFQDFVGTIQNKKQNKKHLSHIEIKLNESNSIVADCSWEYENGRTEKSLTSQVTITTPFDNFREGSIKLDHTDSTGRCRNTILIMHNAKTYVDADASYTKTDQHTATLRFRKPRPMDFEFTGTKSNGNYQGDLNLNWNKIERGNTLRLEASASDNGNVNTASKAISFKLIHPKQTVGVQGSFKGSRGEFTSQGAVSWSQEMDKSASYDLKWTDKSRRQWPSYDSMLKLNILSRSIEMSGSYDENYRTKIFNGTVLWDAENDRDKQVGMAVSYIPGENKEVTIEVKLPKIDKTIRLHSRMTLDSGDVLFDGSSELMYSRDENKKLNINCKIEKSRSAVRTEYHISTGVRHMFTTTDHQMALHLVTSPDNVSVEIDGSYLTSKGRKEHLELEGNLDSGNKQIVVKMLSPRDFKVTGNVLGGPIYKLNLQLEGKSSSMGTQVSVDTVKRFIDLKMNFDPENPGHSFNFMAGFLNRTTFKASAFRLVGSGYDYVQDMLVYVSLNMSRVLHTRLSWRPNMLEDFLGKVKGLGDSGYGQRMNSAMMDLTEFVGEDISQKYNSMAQDFKSELQPVGDMLKIEMDSLASYLDSARRELRRMYRRNDLFLQDLGETYDQAYSNLLERFTQTVSNFKQVYAKSKQKLTETMASITDYPFKENYDKVMEEATEGIKSYRLQTVNYLEEKLAEFTENMKVWAQKQQAHVSELSTNMMNTIGEHARVKQMRQQYDNMVEGVSGLQLDKVNIQKYVDTIQTKINSILPAKVVLMQELKELIQSNIDDFMSREEFQQLRGITDEIYQQGVWTYQYWEVDDNLKELKDKIFESLYDTVMLEKSRYLDCIRNLRKPHIIVFDLEKGEIDVEIYLPVPTEDFYHLPSLNVTKYFTKLRYMADKYIPARNFSLWDVYYKYRPAELSLNLIPPFDAYATVSGAQHFVTFDGEQFDYMGLCSYVLAKDMLDGNFSIVLNYDGSRAHPQMESLIITTNGKNVEIFSNYLVKVDETPMELPYTFQNLNVGRHGNLIVLDDGMGLKVTVDLPHDLIVIGLSGWYFGRTGGLLGSYDNERTNDLITAGKEKTSDIGDFVKSWEVANSCRSQRNLAPTIDVIEGSDRDETCAAFFKDQGSPLRPCFGQVNPEEFYRACIGELKKMKPMEAAICNPSAHYVHHCHMHKVGITLPKMCVVCPGPSSSVYQEGESYMISNEAGDLPVPNSADVVIVVEEKSCNNDLVEQLRELIWNMDKLLKQTGLRENRYGLVGFTRKSAHPYTMEGNLFNNAQKFAMGVESLKLSESDENYNPQDGLKLAANYPFNSGVAKSIILVSCSTCQDVKMRDVEYDFKRKDITLHILRNQEFTLNDEERSKMKILGVDSDEAYTIQDKRDRELKGDLELHSSLQHNSDACMSLAWRTNGSIFDTSLLKSKNIRQKKTFLEIVGKRVRQTATPAPCQTCQCLADDTGFGTSVCQPCSNSNSFWNYIPSAVRSTKLVLPKINEFTQHLKEYLQTR